MIWLSAVATQAPQEMWEIEGVMPLKSLAPWRMSFGPGNIAALCPRVNPQRLRDGATTNGSCSSGDLNFSNVGTSAQVEQHKIDDRGR